MLWLGGCLSPWKSPPRSHALQQALAAQEAGEWHKARAAWALVVSDRNPMPPVERASAQLEYGKALAITCNFDGAERAFKYAYELERNSSRVIYLPLVALFHLQYDQQKFVRAVTSFEALQSELQRAGIPSGAPHYYANLLEEYSNALDRTQRPEEAREWSRKADALRRENPVPYPNLSRTRFGSACIGTR